MTPDLGKILIVDDDQDVLIAAKLLLKRYATAIHTECDPRKIPELLQKETYHIILLDLNFQNQATDGSEGFYWLAQILDQDPSAVVIIVTAYGDVELAVRAIKEGAIDFVQKPWQNEKLIATLSTATKLRRSRLEVKQLRLKQIQLSEEIDKPFSYLLGTSSSMQEIFSLIEKVGPSDANVLVQGENGTGKELVARALYKSSSRANQVFLKVDVGSLSQTLFESELFGHVRGAFTDAREDRVGRFEISSGGTVFLDEISNLALPLQSKLLSVLENQTITRVGSNNEISIDIRTISASNKPLEEMVVKNEFREDLLYRINTVEIQIPPLRDRPKDIPILLTHFLNLYCKRYEKRAKTFDSGMLDKLTRYPWPGNVRELRHAAERAVIMSDRLILKASDILLPGGAPREVRSLTFPDYNLESVEKEVIQKAMQKHDGNVSLAANELGLTRTTLYRRLKRYGI